MKENRRPYWKGVLTGVVCCLVVCLIAQTLFISRREVMLSKNIGGLEKIIEERFLFDYNEEQLEDGLYHGLLAGLNDPYSAYFSPEEYAAMMESTTGEYCGIGAELHQDPNTLVLTVARVFKDSPSDKAGMAAGDVLLEVDGVDITRLQSREVIDKYIRGPEHSGLTLTVRRGDKIVKLDLTREKIAMPTVEFTLLPDRTGYLQITEFSTVTARQFKDAVDALEKQGMERLVLDLRNNPGGSLDATVEIAAYLLPEDRMNGTIVSTRDKNDQEDRFFCQDGQIRFESARSPKAGESYAKPDTHQLDVPMAVLINEHSASASELLTGSLQDYEAATVVGTTSFGKGIVQEVYPLNNGGAIKLTTKRYYTPAGNCIHGKGITPDIEIDLPKELLDRGVIPFEEDVQLKTAIDILKK